MKSKINGFRVMQTLGVTSVVLLIGFLISVTASAQVTSWTLCAQENGVCSFSGTHTVRYGAGTSYFTKTATGSIGCNNSVFGDPAYGVNKHCDYNLTTTTSPAPTPSPTPTPVRVPASASGAPSGPILPIPTNIANGSTVSLQCGTTYQGSLNLAGKSNILVQTVGTCGKATITTGRPVTGWSLYQGNIYSAALPTGFNPVQVSVSGAPMEAAHWPNKPQMWATAGATVSNADLVGARVLTIENLWTVRMQNVSSTSITPSVKFYVEGKLWMLDAAKEWAVSGGRLYLWTADGLSPEGRTWASAQSDYVSSSGVSSRVSDLTSVGINANNASGITIDGVKVFGNSDGISANDATNVRVLNTDVLNSSRHGIYSSGSTGTEIRNSTFTNSNGSGIAGLYSYSAKVVGNIVRTSGIVGMPKPTGGGIFFGYISKDILIDQNQVFDSAYNGITAHINSTVSNNLVDGACTILSDGGGIYTNGRTSGVPLNLHIVGNTIRNVTFGGSKGIYLDDQASYVTVTGNNISATGSGLFIHDGHDNVVTSNTFSSNITNHISLASSSANNAFKYNTFNSTNNELTYQLDGSNSTTAAFATYDYNTYKSTNVSRFGTFNGSYNSYTQWKSVTGQDSHSTMNGVP